MRVFRSTIIVTLVLTTFGASSVPAARFGNPEVQQQNQIFRKHWGVALNWRFDDLPVSGSVPDFRLPYAGAIYLDRRGGTEGALRKYDRAFHRSRPLAVSYEHHDIRIHQQPIPAGPFGIFTTRGTPEWAGHCNGWTAAAIRHAEPKKSVTMNGVVFTPSDIKGLLAEIYVYGKIDELGGTRGIVNPGMLHVILANWIGRGEHPLGMDTTPGEEIWNYPIYAYQSSSAKHSERVVEVNVNIGYVDYTEREFDVGPKAYKFMSFHYGLQLDAQGNIIGGSYYRDSARIDLLWVPLRPTRGQQPESGANPHVNVNTVLSLWRASTQEDLRQKWVTVDPMDQDRATPVTKEELLAQATTKEHRPAMPKVEIDDSVETQGPDTDGSRSAAHVARTLSDYIIVH